MKEEFIPYEQALALKELGWDEPCFTFYLNGDFLYEAKRIMDRENWNLKTNTISAPLYQQALRWFRSEHGLYHSITPEKTIENNGNVSGVEWNVNICGGNGIEIGPKGIFTYSEAELACLKKLIEIVKT